MNRRILSLAFLWMAIALIAGCSAVPRVRAVFDATPGEGYPPLTVALDASKSSSKDSSLLLYDWEYGDGAAESGQAVQHTYFAKGTYVISLRITDSAGQQATAQREVRVLNRIPTAQFTYSPYQPPRDFPVRFDASDSSDVDGEVVRFLWDFGDGTGAEGVFVEHVFPQQRVQYPVILTVIDDDGASDRTLRYVEPIGCDTCG